MAAEFQIRFRCPDWRQGLDRGSRACAIDGLAANLSTMTTKSDWQRGAKGAWQAFEFLHARWPKAFPDKAQDIRPLVNVAAEVQEALDWSRDYTKGVLTVWKAREAYCRAVLVYQDRVGLDGSPTEAIVDDQARTLATARLEQIAAKKAKAADRRAKDAADRAATEATAPPPPPEPRSERPRTRPLLTISPAAKEALAKRGPGTTEVVATIQRRAR